MGESVLKPDPQKRESVAVRSWIPSALFADAGLTRESHSLLLGGVRLSEIAEKAGTPTFVYNAEVIRRQFRTLDTGLAGVKHRVCFAVKANSNLARAAGAT